MTEINVPDANYFQEVGYDRNPGDGTKHYRYVLNKELEKSEYIDKTPFNEYFLLRGQSRGNDGGLFARALGSKKKKSTVRSVGKFKGILRLTEKSMDTLGIDKPESMTDPAEKKKSEELSKKLLVNNEVIVRIYVLECFGLMSMDEEGNSDPYLRFKLGKKVINDVENYLEDASDP